MILVFPYQADTDTREFPWATLGLIAANFAVVLLGGFPLTGAESFVDGWLLWFGSFNPLSWITSAFVHFDWIHLVFNMVFLWAFGFIVEGYLGWRRFLLLYFAIVVADGALTQILMIGSEEGGAAGASGAIYALLAISALWAPRNHLKLFVWIVVIFRTGVEVTVQKFCAIYIGLEVLSASLGGFQMSTAALHLIGAGVGAAAGVLFLKQRWVDTEGWDYLSLREHGIPRKRYDTTVEEPVSPSVRTLVAVRDALADEQPLRADAAYRAAPAGFRLPLADLRKLVAELLAANRPQLAVPHLQEWLELDPQPNVRLRLAQILLQGGQPKGALAQLSEIDESTLTEEQRVIHRALQQQANEDRGSGALELE